MDRAAITLIGAAVAGGCLVAGLTLLVGLQWAEVVWPGLRGALRRLRYPRGDAPDE